MATSNMPETRLCKYYQPLRLGKPRNFRLVGPDPRQQLTRLAQQLGIPRALGDPFSGDFQINRLQAGDVSLRRRRHDAFGISLEPRDQLVVVLPEVLDIGVVDPAD